MDKLEQIFQMQQQLDDSIIKPRGIKLSSEEWIQKKALALICELSEVLDEAKYKWWKNPTPVDQTALREEIVDVVHFVISMCLDAGLTAEQLFEMYKAKNKENHLRQQGLSTKTGYELSNITNKKV